MAGPWEDYGAAPTADAPPPAVAGPWSDYGEAPAQSTTAAGAVQAGVSGLNAGIADVLGLPVDTARNVLELGKAGLGFSGHEISGQPIPEILEPSTTPDVGSSAWIKDRLRKLLPGSIDMQEHTTANRYLHAAGEAVPGALTGQEEASAPAIARSIAGGAAAGVAQQGAADAGLGTVPQVIAGFTGGAAADRSFRPKAPTPEVTRPAITGAPGGFAAPAAAPPHAADPNGPWLNQAQARPLGVSGGTTTAADSGVPPIKLEPLSRAQAPVTPTDEPAREQTLRDVGLTQARDSAVTGDTKEAGTDFQTSRLKNSAGDLMSGTIAGERAALQYYARDMTENTGGSVGTDGNALYQRGDVIARPVEQLSDYFDDKVRNAYKVADQKAGGLPLDMPDTGAFLNNERAQFLGTVEGKQLREGVLARMRDLGLIDQDGNVQQATVAQSERLKQYLNNAWSPRTGGLIRQMKDAIDGDVTRAAGSDIYKDARDARSLRATLLDDPTGIAKLAPPEDRTGINRAVPLERIPDYVANLPVDQFQHLVKTYRNAPPEVQPSSAAALNEIRAQFANNVEKAGNSNQASWNAKAAGQYIRDNQLKMGEVFTPAEMSRFATLHNAGHILHMDTAYPGAEAQRYNMAVRGANLFGKGAVAVGTHVGGVKGAVVGHIIDKGAQKLTDTAVLAQTQKRIRQL
jgi:hypothetical protein